jgi:hypothetical protein
VVETCWERGLAAMTVCRRLLSVLPPSAVEVAVLHYKPTRNAFRTAPQHYACEDGNWEEDGRPRRGDASD